MQDYWPTLFGMYESMLQDAQKPRRARHAQIAGALLDEIKTHDSWDKLREIGLKPDMRIAFYGVGLVPVLRMELGDPAAFKAEVARIETEGRRQNSVARPAIRNTGSSATTRLPAAIAIEGTHLVVTHVPPKASDALKQTLLGVTRPAQSLAAAGTLQALAKQYAYLAVRRRFRRFRAPRRAPEQATRPAAIAEFAQALEPATQWQRRRAVKANICEIAHKFPRAVVGAGGNDAATTCASATQLEIETTLAQQIAAALGAAPGTGAPSQGVVDFSIALPVLKLKDFWIAQADAVAAKPYACASLTTLNDGYRRVQGEDRRDRAAAVQRFDRIALHPEQARSARRPDDSRRRRQAADGDEQSAGGAGHGAT